MSGTPVRVPGGSYTNIGPRTLRDMLASKDVFLLNVHVPYEGEIEGTDVNIPYDEVERRVGQLPLERDARIVVYCRSGRMSAVAVERLLRLGYTRVWHLEGGFVAWRQAGFRLSHR